ncbi:hypothetical protein Z043_106927 [Scleropages formosus]|uniref:DDE-1 domain-containing protein n=1 Tax=Scleropages formosus TaxID=113540 RepID=A0A0P7VJX2_SCLFO|nr:hypothetical protein Z043_106927 [Scleropages formosus]
MGLLQVFPYLYHLADKPVEEAHELATGQFNLLLKLFYGFVLQSNTQHPGDEVSGSLLPSRKAVQDRLTRDLPLQTNLGQEEEKTFNGSCGLQLPNTLRTPKMFPPGTPRDEPWNTEAVQAQQVIQPLLHGITGCISDRLMEGHLVEVVLCWLSALCVRSCWMSFSESERPVPSYLCEEWEWDGSCLINHQQLCLAQLHGIARVDVLKVTKILNMDETPVWFEMPGKSTLTTKGSSEVCVTSTGHKKEKLTVTLAAYADGTKLAPLMRLPGDAVPSGVQIYVWSRRRRLLVWDAFRGHVTSDVKTLAKTRYNSDMAVIPGGCTRKLQPADVSWNRPFKAKLSELYDKWLFSGPVDKTKHGNRKHPSKALLLTWIRVVIRKSFKKCGITVALDGTEDHLFQAESETEDQPFEGFSEIQVGEQVLENVVPSTSQEMELSESDGDIGTDDDSRQEVSYPNATAPATARPSAADLPRPLAAVRATVLRRVFSEMASMNLSTALAWSTETRRALYSSDRHNASKLYLSLWWDRFDAGNVAGDGQDVKLVVNGNTCLAGGQGQDEPGNRIQIN